MLANRAKIKLSEGGVILGVSIQQFRSPEIPRIAAAAGADFLWIDAEHGMFGFETIQELTKAALDAGITPLVRVGELLYSLVARSLDAGAQGIIFPRVERPEVLAEAIGWTKFPPLGKRGFGLGPAQLRYESVMFQDILEHQNGHTMVVVQIETLEALAQAEKLLATRNLDAMLVGPSDLSIALGVPGQFESREMVQAIEGLIETCSRHKVAPGIHVRTMALAEKWINRGMRLVSVGNEATLLYEKLAEVVSHLRNASPAVPAKEMKSCV